MRPKAAVIWNFCILTVAALTLLSCQSMPPDEDPARELRETIAPALGLEFEGELTQGLEKNFVGVRSDVLLLTRRTDSRTYFVQDERFGVTRAGGIFEGSDRELLERCRAISERLGIPANQIKEASVLQVNSNVARLDDSGALRAEPTRKGERYARLVRSIDGVPIFSSSVMLALDRKGAIGFLELHWPEISKEALSSARDMQDLIKRGWKPPALEKAEVESVEAGVLHSPAVGFVMDVQPAIRIIYRTSDGSVGKKPVLYLDGKGRAVEMPRQFESQEVAPEKAREERGHK